jgi:uncharacterized protein YggU (UPF0235/DUF167 family)
MDRPLRVALRVKPGARRPRVGGRYAGPRGDALVVAVTERAVDGRATAAALAAVASAFGVSKSAVVLVSGPTNRDKVVDIGASDAEKRFAELLGADD